MNIPSARTYAWLLAILRIYTGAFCILHAIPKFTNATAFQTTFANLVAKAAASGGPAHAFLLGTVQPHVELFAQLARFGELVTGVLLLLGLLTRLGGLLGVIFAGSALFLQGYPVLQSWASLEATVLALCAVNLVLPTGRVLGIDALWRRRYNADKTQPIPIPPSRPEAQTTVNETDASATGIPAPTPTVATTKGEVEPSLPPREPGPNGANGGPEFAAPASAGPQIDQTTSV